MRLALALALAFALACGSCGGSPAARRAPSVVKTPHGPGWSASIYERCREVEGHMRAAAMTHGIDVGLIAGVIRVESGFSPDATSSAGARGLMQVMPSTARRHKCDDLGDPEDNIECGTRVLKAFLQRFEGNLIYGLSGYNSGIRRPKRAMKRSTLPTNIRYVEKVLAARSHYLRYGCGD